MRTTPLAMPLVDKIFSAERLSLVAVPYTAFTDDGEAIVRKFKKILQRRGGEVWIVVLLFLSGLVVFGLVKVPCAAQERLLPSLVKL